jgi:hypothetical protein
MSFEKALTLDQGRVTQTDVWAAPNFSFKEIQSGLEIEIPAQEQMIVSNSIRVDGSLKVSGEAYVCQFPEQAPFPQIPGDNYSHFEVLSPKLIPPSQEMIASSFVRVNSELRVDGRMTILGSIEPETSAVIPFKILSDKTFHIAQDFEHYFREFISIAGGLRVSGQFAVGA